MGGKLDGAIRDRQAQGGADRALDQTDFAAVGTHQFGGDRQSKPGAAGAGRALERFEQMRACLVRKAWSGVGNFHHHHRAFTPAGDANLIPQTAPAGPFAALPAGENCR